MCANVNNPRIKNLSTKSQKYNFDQLVAMRFPKWYLREIREALDEAIISNKTQIITCDFIGQKYSSKIYLLPSGEIQIKVILKGGRKIK